MFKQSPPLSRQQIFRARTVPERIPLNSVLCEHDAFAASLKARIPDELERFLKSEGLRGSIQDDVLIVSKR